MATGDLTILSAVREHLQLVSGQTDQDALIGTLITQASRMIGRYTGRQFAATAAGTTYKFKYDGQGHLAFTPYDLQSATLVQIDSDTATPTTLVAATDYYLMPLNADDGVYTSMQIRNYSPPLKSSTIDYQPFRQVSITGTWGFAAVPSDVALACNMLVGWLMRNQSTIPAQGMESLGDRFGPVAWPTAVRQLLQTYTAYGFGRG